MEKMSIKSLPLSLSCIAAAAAVVCYCMCKTLRYMHNKSRYLSMLNFMNGIFVLVFSKLNLLYHSILMASILSDPILFLFLLHFILDFSFSCFFFNCYLFCTQWVHNTFILVFFGIWNLPIKSTCFRFS